MSCGAPRHLGEGEPEGLVESPLDDVLAVVVIDLHVVERLKEVEVVEQEPGDVPLHASGELREVVELASSVCERRVLDGEPLHEDVERVEHLLPLLKGHPSVRSMTVQQRLGMKRYVRQIGPEEGLLVARDFIRYGIGLVVNHEREQIVARFPATISALVDEYAQVSSQ